MGQPHMSEKKDDFCALMQRVCGGSEDAAWELVEQYGEAIRRAVRRALNKKLRPKFDSMDFVQMVWSSFFRVRDKLKRFRRPEELAAFLVTMARNKVAMEIRRRLLTKKYDLSREHSLDEPRMRKCGEIAGRQPLPAEVAIAREQLGRMVRGQPKHYRQIIQLRLQGCTYQDIAGSLHLAESTVRRFLKKLFREMVP